VFLQVSFGGRPAEDTCVCVYEGQILTLLWRKAGDRGRHYTSMTRGKRLVLFVGEWQAQATAAKGGRMR
jgi:hypothetical protein